MANAAVMFTTDASSRVLLPFCVLLRAQSRASMTADVTDLKLAASTSCSPPALQLHSLKGLLLKCSHPS